MKGINNKKIIGFFAACALNFIFFSAGLYADTIKEINKLEAREKQRAPEKALIRPKVEYKAGDFKDPFRGYTRNIEFQASQKEVILPALTVQGIVWGAQVPQAIINNKVLKIGDTIENVHIVDINRNGIDVFFEGRQFNLTTAIAGSSGQVKSLLKGEGR